MQIIASASRGPGEDLKGLDPHPALEGASDVLQMRDVRDYSGFFASRGVKKRRMIVSYILYQRKKQRRCARPCPHSSAVGYCAILLCGCGVSVGYDVCAWQHSHAAGREAGKRLLKII